MKIDKLTNEQTALLKPHADKWIKIGLSTKQADRIAAERAISVIYKSAGFEKPKIVWCGSPLSQGLTRAIIVDGGVGASVGDSVGASVRASVRDSVRASVGASVGASAWDSVGDSAWASVGASVWDSVRASVGASVWDSVRASVGDSVGDSVWDSAWASVGDSVWASVGASVWASAWASVGASVRDSVGASGYGQHDANWLGFYEFFRERGLKEQTEKLAGHIDQAKAAGWYLPHEKICWVSERHHVLERDDRGRLHCVSGPAVAYPDGWKIYAVHGVRVGADCIENPSSITTAQIAAEKNAEVKRVLIELFGWTRYLRELNAKIIDKRKNDIDGTRETLVRAGESTVLVCACPSTARVYALEVPADIESCRQAQSFLSGGLSERIVSAS